MQLDKKSALRLLGVVCGAILFYTIVEKPATAVSFVGTLFSLIFPLLLGCGIAFVLNLPMRQLERIVLVKPKNKRLIKLRRPICLTLSIIFVCAVVALVMGLVVPELGNAFGMLASSVPKYLASLQQWSLEHAGDYPQVKEWITGISVDWSSLTNKLVGYVTSGATNLLGGTFSFVTALAGSIMNAVIGIIFAFYVLLNKETRKRQMRSFLDAILPQKLLDKLLYVGNLTKTTFESYVTGQCLEACILGSLCWIGMLILRLPYAPMIGALVAFMALVPMFGAFLSMGIGAFMIFMVSPIQALWFVIFLFILQQIEGNLIYPHVVGSQVGLPGMWVLAFITIGGAISGLAGML
ncbi:MAG: AI-2E family transporter, partial [Ruminococcaceae bacterium]|nr:AI-2E family transporter [Oscillospiraceae bacterium]